MIKVNVEIHYNEEDPGRVGFIIESDNGEALTAQDIIDAVSDALVQYFDNWTGQFPPLDS